MEIEVGFVNTALSSCCLRTKMTSVVCSIFLEQKSEIDPQVSVEFPGQECTPVYESIKSMIEFFFEEKSRSTRIKVILYIVKKGHDLFSCCANSFSVCVILSGLRISDTICSSTIYVDDVGRTSMIYKDGASPVHMAYLLYTEKVAQVFFDCWIRSESVSGIICDLVSACNEVGSLIRQMIEDIIGNKNDNKV